MLTADPAGWGPIIGAALGAAVALELARRWLLVTLRELIRDELRPVTLDLRAMDARVTRMERTEEACSRD